jgi:alpha/beta superfamily hydrolase
VASIELQGPAGRLEALWETPAGPARFTAVVCHPHPLHGGTMHNHATYRIARAVRSRGGISLRFNFRGVGLSAGAHAAGEGEQGDVRAALDLLARERGDLPRLACGFSFGSWMALEVACGDPEVRGVLAAGLALRLRETAAATAASCPRPVAIVQAERDEYGTPDEVERALAGASGERRVLVVPGATHLCTENLEGLEREVGLALDWLLDRAGIT